MATSQFCRTFAVVNTHAIVSIDRKTPDEKGAVFTFKVKRYEKD